MVQVENEFGTFWYHAHSAMLRNTVMGALVVDPSGPLAPEEALPTPFGTEFVSLA